MIAEQFEALFDRAKGTMDRITGYSMLRRKFNRTLGYSLNLQNPTTWNEKIQWRKINVRNPDFVPASDKLAMPGFVIQLLGAEHCEGLFTKIHAKTNDPNTLDFDDLPEEFVLKPTHGSGWLTVVRSDTPRDDGKLRQKCWSWLARNYGYRNHEWPYTQIEPRIMVEELLLTNDGKVANDVKLHVMNGKIIFAQYDKNRGNVLKRQYVNSEWKQLCNLTPPPSEEPILGWEKMKDITLRIGQHFDYVRVDFLSTETRFALNELTFYPASGFNCEAVNSMPGHDFDVFIGKQWNPKIDGRT